MQIRNICDIFIVCKGLKLQASTCNLSHMCVMSISHNKSAFIQILFINSEIILANKSNQISDNSFVFFLHLKLGEIVLEMFEFSLKHLYTQ